MPCPNRLLIAGHDAERGSASIADVFRPLEALGVDLVTTTTPEATRAALADGEYDVLVVDATSFRDLTRALDRAAGLPPILLVADPGDPIPAVVAGRSLRGELWDLVHRDAPAEELLLRTERLVEQTSTLAELERARYHASHDDLTGLLRPVRFAERLHEHFSAALRHRLEFALVLIDLDRFGRVNKDFDHVVGDELISRVGSVIRMSLRTEDVGGRIGGDEFALVLPYTQRVDAARVVTRLAGRFRALSGPAPRPFAAGHRAPVAGSDSGAEPRSPSIQVSASLGFETFDGSDIESHEEMRLHAERALSVAKSRGGNQAVYYRNLSPDEIAGADGPLIPRSPNQHRTEPVRAIEHEVPRRIDLQHE